MFAEPVGVVEGRVGEDVVDAEVGMEVAREGVSVLGAEVGLDAAQGEVHDVEAAGWWGCALLAVDADAVELATMGEADVCVELLEFEFRAMSEQPFYSINQKKATTVRPTKTDEIRFWPLSQCPLWASFRRPTARSLFAANCWRQNDRG